MSKKRLTASDLRHRVTLQSPVVSQNTLGDSLITWQTQEYIWANVQPINGKEEFIHSGLKHQTTYRITIRYHADIKENWRVIYQNRILQLNSIYDIEGRRILLECVATQIK